MALRQKAGNVKKLIAPRCLQPTHGKIRLRFDPCIQHFEFLVTLPPLRRFRWLKLSDLQAFRLTEIGVLLQRIVRVFQKNDRGELKIKTDTSEILRPAKLRIGNGSCYSIGNNCPRENNRNCCYIDTRYHETQSINSQELCQLPADKIRHNLISAIDYGPHVGGN